MRRALILPTHGVGHPFRNLLRAQVNARRFRERLKPAREDVRFFSFTFVAAFFAFYTYIA
jgi:hypothetical protein